MLSVSVQEAVLTSLRRTLSSLPRTYWYLWVGSLINRMGGVVIPFLTLYLTQERQMTVAQAGAVVSAYGAGSVLASPAGGWLADHLGRRTTLLLGLFGATLSMSTLSLIRAPLALSATVFAVGFTTDLVRPALLAMLADVVPADLRLRAYVTLYWAFNLGFSIAPVVGGLLASRSFVLLFLSDAATTALFGLLVWWRIPETRPDLSTTSDGRTGASGAGRDWVLLAFTGLGFITAFLFMQSMSTLPLMMVLRGLTRGTYGTVIALNGLLIITLQPFTSRWLARHRRSHVLASASLLTGLGFALTGWARTPFTFAVSIAVWTLGEIALTPVASAVVADLAPEHARGRYQGIYFLSWSAALLLAPSVGTLVFEHMGPQVLWASCGALGVLGALGHVAIAPARRRRVAELRAQGLLTSAHLD